MNIFYLDHDVQKCAEMHCDKHVVKMILEYAQLLCTAHHAKDTYICQEEFEIKRVNEDKLGILDISCTKKHIINILLLFGLEVLLNITIGCIGYLLHYVMNTLIVMVKCIRQILN